MEYLAAVKAIVNSNDAIDQQLTQLNQLGPVPTTKRSSSYRTEEELVTDLNPKKRKIACDQCAAPVARKHMCCHYYRMNGCDHRLCAACLPVVPMFVQCIVCNMYVDEVVEFKY